MKTMKSGRFGLRKTSDIRQEHALYEIIDEDRRILLDVTKSDAGIYEVSMMDSHGDGRVIELNVLLDLIKDAQHRIEADE